MEAVQRLLTIMARLRDPEGGCPWDRRQTYATIVPYTLEEAYEVADAIQRRDMRELRDELGDLVGCIGDAELFLAVGAGGLDVGEHQPRAFFGEALGDKAGVVEALSIRTVRLRDLAGVVHTIPFSSIEAVSTSDFRLEFWMRETAPPESTPCVM